MPIGGTSDTQYPDAGCSCLLSDRRIVAVPHLVVQHLGKMYATKPPLGSLQPCIFPAYTFPIGILDYIFLIMCATRRRFRSTSTLRASRSPWAHRSRYFLSSSAVSGLGKEPPSPARCRCQNMLWHTNSSAALSMANASSPCQAMRRREVPMCKEAAVLRIHIKMRRSFCSAAHFNAHSHRG